MARSRPARIALVVAAFVAAGAARADGPSISRGDGQAIATGILSCPGGGFIRPTGIGRVTATDGTEWIVPADTTYRTARKLPDLYNDCSSTRPASLAEVKLDDIAVIEIDPDGEIVTGYIFADNYFELYVNGKLVGVDAVPFTPFNSAVVRFKAKRPITYAILAVDWEENFGTGTEAGGGGRHPGDAGFVARFSDGTMTDSSWKAQSFYIAPLAKPGDVVENGAVHDTSKLGRVYPDAERTAACGNTCYAVHYPIPANWTAPAFDASAWPNAFEYTEDQAGGGAAYNRFTDAFGRARFVWSNNLVYDNLVLFRKTAP